MDEKLLLKAVVLAGEIMLSSGAEVSRVENTHAVHAAAVQL